MGDERNLPDKFQSGRAYREALTDAIRRAEAAQRAVVPLCPGPEGCHARYDRGDLDLLPFLEPAWRDSQEWAAGAVGLASALRSITGNRMEAMA